MLDLVPTAYMDFPKIIGFSSHEMYKHDMVKLIKQAERSGDPSFIHWTSASRNAVNSASGASVTSSKVLRDLPADMVDPIIAQGSSKRTSTPPDRLTATGAKKQKVADSGDERQMNTEIGSEYSSQGSVSGGIALVGEAAPLEEAGLVEEEAFVEEAAFMDGQSFMEDLDSNDEAQNIIKHLANQLEVKKSEIAKKKMENVNLSKQVADKTGENTELKLQLALKTKDVEDLQVKLEQVTDQMDDNAALNIQLALKTKHVEELQERLKKVCDKNAELKSRIAQKQGDHGGNDDKYMSLYEQVISEKDKRIADKEKDIKTLKAALAAHVAD